MRMSTLGLITALGLSAAGVAWAADKKEDGPGMTMNQRIGTMFGLIDGGSNAAPPAPPGMPAMGQRGLVHYNPKTGQATTSAIQPGATAQAASRPTTVVAPAPKSVPSFVTADSSLPQPPQPQSQRIGGASGSILPLPAGATAAPVMVAARPQNSAGTTAPAAATPPKTSIVGASKQPLFATQSTAGASGAGATPTFSTASGGGSSRRKPIAAETPAPTAVPALQPVTPIPTPIPTPVPSGKPIPVNQPDVPTLSTVEATPSATSPAVPPSIGAGNEPFVPTLPLTPAPQSAASMASSSQPNALPLLPVERSSSTPIPVNRPESAASTLPTPVAVARPDLLASHTSPELSLETVGPRKAAVGREAPYRVLLRNRGSVEARDVIVQLEVPQHAEIAELHGTSGSSTSADEFAAGRPLEWRLDVVPAQSQEELTVVLVPRKSEAFELGVRWSSSTPIARATVEVQEPKLALAISGPGEVSYGEQRLYKLTVTNPGNGTAENVVLQLLPLNPGDGGPLSHTVGNLRPGESNSIEVELTARQAGLLSIRTTASADGNLKADAVAEVTVRRAELDVTASAPKLLFAGVPGTYEVRVRNTGDDTARNVRLSVELPPAAKVLSTTPSIGTTTSAGPLSWTFDRIAAGSEQVCTIKCAWDGTGRQQLTVVAAGEGELRKSAVAATEVQAVADLALDVIDTPGPAPVGKPVTFEIRVKNRGLKSAEGVDVVAYFAEGIEPEKAEGHPADLQPGMAVFKTLPTVGPGQERVLKVTARAQKPGNLRMRVEMTSAAPQIELSREDATFFYVDDPQAGEPTAASPAAFQPQAASPISQTGTALPVGAKPYTASPITPSYRTNDLR